MATVEPHLTLCLSVIELARIAAARLTVRDAALGFSRLAAPQRTALQAQADRWDDVADDLVRIWRNQPRGAGRQLAAMARSDEELVLFALAAAPQIDRTLGRAYRSLAGVTDLTVGVLLDLAAAALDHRLQLVRLLHGDRALRASGLLELAHRGAAMLDDRVEVSRSAVAALRGETIVPPGPVAAEHAELPGEVAETVEAAVQLPRWSPGQITIVSGPAAERAALLTVRAALDGREVWHVSGPGPDPMAWCRDAALSGVHLDVAAADPRAAFDAMRQSAAWTHASVVISCDDNGLADSSPSGSRLIQTASLRAAAGSGVSGAVPAGRVRTALETLGF